MNEEIHLHFDNLIAPFQHRLTLVEERVRHMDDEVEDLHVSVKDLKMVLEQHTVEENQILAEINRNIQTNRAEIKAQKSWLIGIGTGVSLVMIILALLDKIGVM